MPLNPARYPLIGIHLSPFKAVPIGGSHTPVGWQARSVRSPLRPLARLMDGRMVALGLALTQKRVAISAIGKNHWWARWTKWLSTTRTHIRNHNKLTKITSKTLKLLTGQQHELESAHNSNCFWSPMMVNDGVIKDDDEIGKMQFQRERERERNNYHYHYHYCEWEFIMGNLFEISSHLFFNACFFYWWPKAGPRSPLGAKRNQMKGMFINRAAGRLFWYLVLNSYDLELEPFVC